MKIKAEKCQNYGLGRGPNGEPEWHIPRTNEAYDAMREQVGANIQQWLNGYALPAKYETVADAALGAIGITRPKKSSKNLLTKRKKRG